MSRVDISLNVTEATTEDEISLFTFANFGTESNIRDNSSFSVFSSNAVDGRFLLGIDPTTTGVKSANALTVNGGSSSDFITFNQNECFVAYIDGTADSVTPDPMTVQDFTISISTTNNEFLPSVGPSAYNFDIDTSDASTVTLSNYSGLLMARDGDGNLVLTNSGDNPFNVQPGVGGEFYLEVSNSSRSELPNGRYFIMVALIGDSTIVTSLQPVGADGAIGSTLTSVPILDQSLTATFTIYPGTIPVSTVFAGNVFGTLPANANASTALTTIGTAITNAFSTVTVGAVTTETDSGNGTYSTQLASGSAESDYDTVGEWGWTVQSITVVD